LNTGEIFAVSQSEGRIPEFSNCSNITGTISRAQFFNSYKGSNFVRQYALSSEDDLVFG